MMLKYTFKVNLKLWGLNKKAFIFQTFSIHFVFKCHTDSKSPFGYENMWEGIAKAVVTKIMKIECLLKLV